MTVGAGAALLLPGTSLGSLPPARTLSWSVAPLSGPHACVICSCLPWGPTCPVAGHGSALAVPSPRPYRKAEIGGLSTSMRALGARGVVTVTGESQNDK